MPPAASDTPLVMSERHAPPTADDCRVCRGSGRQRVERDSYITEPCDACANELMRWEARQAEVAQLHPLFDHILKSFVSPTLLTTAKAGERAA